MRKNWAFRGRWLDCNGSKGRVYLAVLGIDDGDHRNNHPPSGTLPGSMASKGSGSISSGRVWRTVGKLRLVRSCLAEPP